jgi:hypothetical protein
VVASNLSARNLEHQRITASGSSESPTSICKKIGATVPISGKSNYRNSSNFYCRSDTSEYFTDDYFSSAQVHSRPLSTCLQIDLAIYLTLLAPALAVRRHLRLHEFDGRLAKVFMLRLENQATHFDSAFSDAGAAA